jgi:hypothetical protein
VFRRFSCVTLVWPELVFRGSDIEVDSGVDRREVFAANELMIVDSAPGLTSFFPRRFERRVRYPSTDGGVFLLRIFATFSDSRKLAKPLWGAAFSPQRTKIHPHDLEKTQTYRFILHDRDAIFSPGFDASIARMGLEVIETPVRSPKVNSLCERLIGTLRRECLDWIIPLTEEHLRKTLLSSLPHYNRGRPLLWGQAFLIHP